MIQKCCVIVFFFGAEVKNIHFSYMWGRIRLRFGVTTLRPPFWGVPPEERHFVSVKTSARNFAPTPSS